MITYLYPHTDTDRDTIYAAVYHTHFCDRTYKNNYVSTCTLSTAVQCTTCPDVQIVLLIVPWELVRCLDSLHAESSFAFMGPHTIAHAQNEVISHMTF
jgi:hypothetical protein